MIKTTIVCDACGGEIKAEAEVCVPRVEMWVSGVDEETGLKSREKVVLYDGHQLCRECQRKLMQDIRKTVGKA